MAKKSIRFRKNLRFYVERKAKGQFETLRALIERTPAKLPEQHARVVLIGDATVGGQRHVSD
jgi:hypothetical protein